MNRQILGCINGVPYIRTCLIALWSSIIAFVYHFARSPLILIRVSAPIGQWIWWALRFSSSVILVLVFQLVLMGRTGIQEWSERVISAVLGTIKLQLGGENTSGYLVGLYWLIGCEGGSKFERWNREMMRPIVRVFRLTRVPLPKSLRYSRLLASAQWFLEK